VTADPRVAYAPRPLQTREDVREELERAAALLETHGVPILRGDFTAWPALGRMAEDAAREWAGALVDQFGHVDALLHLVGGWRGGEPIATTSLEDYEWLHDALVHTVQHTTRAFYEQIAASEHGRFVLVSSSQAQRPDGTNASYAATKAAAESWTLALADSLEDTQATANIIVVNAILTPRMREANPEKEFRTFTSAEDLADAIRFVVGDSSAKMNGTRLSLHP